MSDISYATLIALTSQWTVKETLYAVKNSVVQIAKLDPTRVSLVVCQCVGNTAQASIGTSPTIVLASGLLIGLTNPPFIINYATVGGLVQQAWYMIGAMSTGFMTIIETFLRDSN